MFKKNAMPSNQSPTRIENREGTTYNYTYREPIAPTYSYNNSYQNSQEALNFQQQAPQPQDVALPKFPQSSPAKFEFTPRLQHEAEQRSLNRSHTNTIDQHRPKGFMELNRLANKLNTDNQPSNDYPNHSYWFGRAGQFKTAIGGFTPDNNSSYQYSSDPRRRKLLDSLENRSPRDLPKVYGLDNSNLPKSTQLAFVNDPHSNHRNMYENSQ